MPVLPLRAASYIATGEGHVAEWLRNGLQNRVHRFNSGRGLHHFQTFRVDIAAIRRPA